MYISRIMKSPVIVASPTTTVGQARDILRSNRIKQVPVVSQLGELVGMVSERDLGDSAGPRPTWASPGEEALAPDTPVSAVMATPPLTVEPNTELEEAFDLILERRIGALPVMLRGTLLGIVSYGDLTKKLSAPS